MAKDKQRKYMMQNEFSRTALLIGEDAVKRLKTKHVAVFGIGGVGSFAAEALARSGIGSLTLIDDDTVCITNINRQLIALHSTIGRPKAEVMRERILDINPAASVTARCCFYSPETAPEFDLGEYDYVVDAIDTVTAKLELISRAAAAGVPVISSMGAGNKLDPSRFEITDIYSTSVCPLARVMRRELRRLGVPSLKVVYSKEPALSPLNEHAGPDCESAGCVYPSGSSQGCEVRRQIPGSIAFVPSVAGLMLACEIIRDLMS